MNIITSAGGTPTRVTASGVTNITSGNAVLVGALANGTIGTIDLFHGTATGTTTAIIVSGLTLVSGVFAPIPANCSGGLTVLATGFTNVNVTFFWNPISRT